MYTSYVGRRALDLYSDHMHDGPPLSPKSFFDDVLFPLFFDDGRYLFWPNNAPFAQPKYSGSREEADVRQEALAETHEKIGEIQRPVGHLFMGGMADGPMETTSGQVSAVGASTNSEEAYCSWIGAGCGVGLSGGLSMLIDEDSVLRALLEGWELYRTYLDQTPGLKGNQITTWNGQWLAHRFGWDYHPEDPLRDFDPHVTSTGISTKDWAQLLFALARHLPDRQLTVYLYSLGNTNQTIGFRKLLLPEVQHMAELHERLFGDVEGVSARRLADAFEPAFSIYRACKQGAIGLKALQPDRLRKYMPGRRDSKMPGTTRSENKFTRYLIFQTWIIAMLNNEDLIDTTEQLAEALREYAQSDDTTTTTKRTAEQVLEASHRREFLESLSVVIKDDATHADLIDEIGDEVVKMPSSDFPLFATLLRLKYHVFSQQQSV
jgi:uncharacterized protein YnzC (UPF0291/DUF896 family)